MRRFLIAALIAGSVTVPFLLLPSLGSADPNLGDVPKHQHYLVLVSGTSMTLLARFGPDLCENPNVQQAFNQFHNNNHVLGQGAIGPLNPGLNDDEHTEIVARGCTAPPPGS